MNVNISGDITKGLKITNLSEYLQLKYPDIDFDDDDLDRMHLYDDPENQIAEQIITLQVAVILLWLTPYLGGGQADILRSMVTKKKEEYKAINGNDYIDYNKGSNSGL